MPRALETMRAVSSLHASWRVAMIGKTASPAPAVAKSLRQCLALPLTSFDADVMQTIGPPSLPEASCRNAPSASPFGVHAPPIITSVPARTEASLSLCADSDGALGDAVSREVSAEVLRAEPGCLPQQSSAAEAHSAW